MNFRDRLIFAFGAALLLVTAIAVVSYRRIVEQDNDLRRVEHTHVVLEAVDSAFADLLDHQSTQRGYAMTGDASFLQRATAAQERLRRGLSRLRELTIDNAAQQSALDRIESLAQRQIVLYGDSAGPGKSSQRERASRMLMEEIRAAVQEMKATEERLLDERSAAAARHDTQVRRVIAGGYVMFFLALALAAASSEERS